MKHDEVFHSALLNLQHYSIQVFLHPDISPFHNRKWICLERKSFQNCKFGNLKVKCNHSIYLKKTSR